MLRFIYEPEQIDNFQIEWSIFANENVSIILAFNKKKTTLKLVEPFGSYSATDKNIDTRYRLFLEVLFLAYIFWFVFFS